MRLVNPGAGEISDRLTILALKIRAGLDQGKVVKHFEVERAALLTQIHSRTLNGRWFEHVLELAAVNAFLWHAEDALRVMRVGTVDWESVARLAMRIQELNDRRSELVGQINAETGDAVGKEKA